MRFVTLLVSLPSFAQGRRLRAALLGVIVSVVLSTSGAAQGLSDVQGSTTLTTPVFISFVDARRVPEDELADPAHKTIATYSAAAISKIAVNCGAVEDIKTVTTGHLWGLLECAQGRRLGTSTRTTGLVEDRLTQRIAAAKLIAKALHGLAGESSTRAISYKGDYLLTAVIQTASLKIAKWSTVKPDVDQKCKADREFAVAIEGRVPKVHVSETERESQLGRDLSSLLRVGAAVIGAQPVSSSTASDLMKRLSDGSLFCAAIQAIDVPFVTAHDHAFTHTRATVAVEVSLPDDRPSRLLARSLPTEFPNAPSENEQKPADPLTVLEELVKDQQEAAEVERQKKALQNLVRQCPPSGIEAFSPIHILTCRLLTVGRNAERIAAAGALGELGLREAALPLALAASTNDPEVRAAALRALGKIPPAGTANSRAAQPAAAGGSGQTRSLSFISGPREHWFISADVMVSSKNELKVEDGELVLADDPASFYVGFGFLLGDLASDKRRLLENLAIKLLVKGSDSPLDSIGAAVALRGEYLKKWGLSFELLSPFVAHTWTRSETASARKSHWRFGLSLNIDKAVEWLK